MSEVKVNKISPRTACGTVTLGDSGDTFTIPSGATITNAGTASGFGATGETSWDTTVKTTGTFTATAGVGYFLNTTGGTITVNLPVGAAGSSVALADYAGTWQTNNVTLAANGTEKIGGVDADVTLSTEGQSVTFVYIDGTQGWVNVLDSTSNVRGNSYLIATGGCITTCGNDKVHTFLSPGTFCVSVAAVCAANNLVSYAVVAGAGGGGGSAATIPSGSYWSAGGGGAGGFRELVSPTAPYTASPLDGYPTPGNRITVTATPYAIAVGGGGPGGIGHDACGTRTNGGDGNPSSGLAITSAGGGGGGKSGGAPGCTSAVGQDGGSGGGGGGFNNDICGARGLGNVPPTTPPQGQNGGTGYGPSSGFGGGGGGSGAGGTPAPSVAAHNAAGGVGVATEISTASVTYAAGGNAGNNSGASSVGAVNTGNAGQGGNYGPLTCGAAGGSGIVIIRYKYQ